MNATNLNPTMNEDLFDCANLPEGWRTTRLDNVCTMLSGGTPSKSNSAYWNGDIPWLSAKDLKSFRLSSAQDNITAEGANNGTRLVPANTLLILVRGMTLHKDVPVGITTCPVTFNQDLKALTVHSSINPAYLGYWLVANKERLMTLVDSAGHGTGRLPTELLGQVEVSIPENKAEQSRIVEVLDDADAVVRALDALIDAKLRHKHAQAERLLSGLCRFPEFKGQEWRDIRLSAFFREKAASAPVGVPPLVLSCSKIHGIVPQSQIFSRSLASKDLKRYKYIEPGDLVFDPMLLWDASIAFSEYTGVVSPAYCTFQFVGANADPRFFRYLFATHVLKHTYKTISQGTNTRRKKAPASDFLNIQVSIPGGAEQRRIADTLSLLDEEIKLLRGQHTRQQQIKHGLMQSLLLGHARVREFAP